MGREATEAHLTKIKAQYQTFQTQYSLFLWYLGVFVAMLKIGTFVSEFLKICKDRPGQLGLRNEMFTNVHLN